MGPTAVEGEMIAPRVSSSEPSLALAWHSDHAGVGARTIALVDRARSALPRPCKHRLLFSWEAGPRGARLCLMVDALEMRTFGEQQGAAVRGQETSRRMNAGPPLARVERGSAYMPPSNSRVLESVIARNDRRTMRRCARLATPGAGSRASRDPVCCSRGHERSAPAPTGPTIDRYGSGNPGRDMFG